MRRIVIAIFVTVALVALAAPAGAGPPDRFEDTFPIAFPDFENGFAVFVNTSRELVCTPEREAFEAWEFEFGEAFFVWTEILGMPAEDFPGDPPPADPGPFPAIDPIAIQGKETGKGAIVQKATGSDLPTELWVLDEEDLGVGPCSDTDDADELFATGTTRWQANDNDFFGSDTRSNAFGDRGKATLEGVDGMAYTYMFKFHINSRCHGPEFGPPACLVDSATLR